MKITEHRPADVVSLSLSGKLDTNTAKAFQDQILARIESGERRIVVDLEQLDYISSADLRVIMLAGQRLSSVNGKVVLCSLKHPIRGVFDIAGFVSIFSIYGSHDDATNGSASVNNPDPPDSRSSFVAPKEEIPPRKRNNADDRQCCWQVAT